MRDGHQGRRGVVAAHRVGLGEGDDAVVVEAGRGVVGEPAAVGQVMPHRRERRMGGRESKRRKKKSLSQSRGAAKKRREEDGTRIHAYERGWSERRRDH